MSILSIMHRAGTVLLICLLGLPALADTPGGLVTGSFGDQQLELTVTVEFSEAMIIGSYADMSLLATQTEGNQGPVNLQLVISGALPAPDEVALTITFARGMGQNWSGDQDSLTLVLDEFASNDGIITMRGMISGEVAGGSASETRPVTFSFDTRLEELD